MPKRLSILAIAAWVLLAAVALVTLAPIEWRPVSPLSAQWERLLSFALVGFVFALAYRRHLLLISVVVVGAAVGLELLQLLASSRHGRLPDLGAKLVGGTGGLVAGWLSAVLRDRLAARRRMSQSPSGPSSSQRS